MRLLAIYSRIIVAALISACAGASVADRIDVDALPQLTLEEELRIGSNDDPDYGFSRIGSVAVDHEGHLFVFESRDRQIRTYSPDGQLIRTFGRRGSGPGEFQTGSVRFGIRGDTVWTLETIPPRRISLFSREGTHLTTSGPIEGITVELETDAMLGLVLPYEMLPDGYFSSDMFSTESLRPYSIEEYAQFDRNPVAPVPRIRFDVHGTVVDTVGADLRLSTERLSSPGTVEIGGQRYMLPYPPFASPLSITLGDGRIIVERPLAASSDDGTFTVTRIDLNRDTVYHRKFRYVPVGYSTAILDTLSRSVVVGMAGAMVLAGTEVIRIPELPANQDEVVRALRAEISLPPFQPPIRAFFLSDNGWLWLSRQDNGEAEYAWIVLRPDGTPAGVVHLPRDASLEWSDGETVWISLPDEFDVPWLVKYRIRR